MFEINAIIFKGFDTNVNAIKVLSNLAKISIERKII